MTELCGINILAQKWHLTYFVPIDGHFGQMFCDMNFKFVLPFIYINFDIQTKFEVNQTKIGHYILQNTPKTHQGSQISKPHFAQVLFTNLSETFRINVNMDFAQILSPKFWAQNNLEA